MAVTAFAPASLTTVFVPREAETGSLGVSMALSDGVTVSLEPATETDVTLDGEPTAVAPVSGVLDELGVDAAADVVTEIPIGCGFGVSGAATLATALAAAEAAGLDRSREELVQAAHRAELAAGTGQGDVFVQDRGGLVWNTGEGVGQHAREDPLGYSTFGSIDTASVLGDEAALERITAAGTTALESFDPGMPLTEWFPTAWSFARQAELPTERVRETVQAVEDAGGTATMAMLGETVVGTPTPDVFEAQTSISPNGARLL
ncbi:MAG: GHMP kinase [Halodesulfurarchaeum sp.]